MGMRVKDVNGLSVKPSFSVKKKVSFFFYRIRLGNKREETRSNTS